MTSREPRQPGSEQVAGAASHQILIQLDLIAEALERLDELGVDSRAELEALAEQLERLIAESD
jgi:hypothetical protein